MTGTGPGSGHLGQHWTDVSRQEGTHVLSGLHQTPRSRRGRRASSGPLAPFPPACDTLCLGEAHCGLSVPICDPVCDLTALENDSKFRGEFGIAHGLFLS